MAFPLTDYSSAVAALCARTAGQVKPGLSRTEAMLLALDDPHKRVPAFHVAGTNGKGSTCAIIDALLRSRGLRVGRYTSPHLIDFRERIVVDNVPISEEAVLHYLRFIERSAILLQATFFEITTAMAFWHFAQQRVDVAVIETGLGGMLDSTNVSRPVVAAVTSIDLDHTEYLGPTLEDIAGEKAGIFKFGRPAIIGEPRADLAGYLADLAAQRGASPNSVVHDDWPSGSDVHTERGVSWTATTPVGVRRFSIPLYGEHQVRNALTAIAAVWMAGEPYRVPMSDIDQVLANVWLPGRFQRVGEWLFDVAHNAAGARVLAETLRASPVPTPVTAVVGILGHKYWRGMLDALAPVVDTFIITQPPSAPQARAWNPMEAGLYANRLKVPVILEVNFDIAMLRAQETNQERSWSWGHFTPLEMPCGISASIRCAQHTPSRRDGVCWRYAQYPQCQRHRGSPARPDPIGLDDGATPPPWVP